MDILCCRITIGDADPSNPMRIQNGVEITEVQSLEINESYKKLIGTAKVIFPKGSVCRSTIIGNVTLEGKDVSRITTEVMQDGVIIEKRSAQRLVDETTFKVGQRINIKLGYNGVLKNMFDGYITGYNSDSTMPMMTGPYRPLPSGVLIRPARLSRYSRRMNRQDRTGYTSTSMWRRAT